MGFLKNGDLLVANIGASRIERFGAGAELPTCTGDLDCDGLPDDFEASGGLNPGSPGDGLADTDGDGLSNLEELALGTNPSRRDTDGDGWTDRDEVVAGFDPLDPADHRPQLLASGPAQTGPGLVQLSASIVSGAGCAIAWAQQSGPAAVELRGASGASPSYVARAAGTYVIEARAICGSAVSEPALVATEILPQAPLADAGGIRVVGVVAPATPLLLDAGASSDANADVLSFSWDQLLGTPVIGTTTGPLLPLEVAEAGYYVFAATALDPSGRHGVAEVPVLVVEGTASTAMVSTPLLAAAGEAVLLDASDSFVAAPEAVFRWSQVEGPGVALETSGGSIAQFVPPAPGRYGFEVWIDEGTHRSPPARADVYVTAPGGALPSAAIAAVAPAEVGQPLTLDGAGSSGGALAYAWRQVGGPAAGLTGAAAPIATVVPFEPGSHEFELVVRDGPVESLPARVRFDATKPGVTLPVAIATGPSVVARGRSVVLDATGSTGVGLRYAWTQIAGPWVALAGADGPTPSFDADVEGVYSFELVVESGGVRSAPAVVSVLATHPSALRFIRKEHR
jgi:hypothetical protein